METGTKALITRLTKFLTFYKNTATEMSRDEIQEMIDYSIAQAMARHNRNASMISMALGIVFLALFMDGFFRAIGLIPPFMGIDINLLK